jgi:hypothetical protein
VAVTLCEQNLPNGFLFDLLASRIQCYVPCGAVLRRLRADGTSTLNGLWGPVSPSPPSPPLHSPEYPLLIDSGLFQQPTAFGTSASGWGTAGLEVLTNGAYEWDYELRDLRFSQTVLMNETMNCGAWGSHKRCLWMRLSSQTLQPEETSTCQTRNQQEANCKYSYTGFLFSLFFNPEDGSDMFLRNYGWFFNILNPRI